MSAVIEDIQQVLEDVVQYPENMGERLLIDAIDDYALRPLKAILVDACSDNGIEKLKEFIYNADGVADPHKMFLIQLKWMKLHLQDGARFFVIIETDMESHMKCIDKDGNINIEKLKQSWKRIKEDPSLTNANLP